MFSVRNLGSLECFCVNAFSRVSSWLCSAASLLRCERCCVLQARSEYQISPPLVFFFWFFFLPQSDLSVDAAEQLAAGVRAEPPPSLSLTSARLFAFSHAARQL